MKIYSVRWALRSPAMCTQAYAMSHWTLWNAIHIVRIANYSSFLSYWPVFFCSLSSVRYIGKADSITISVWNHKKIHKKQGAGFLGCVRLLSNAINRLKDTGCEYPFVFVCLHKCILCVSEHSLRSLVCGLYIVPLRSYCGLYPKVPVWVFGEGW